MTVVVGGDGAVAGRNVRAALRFLSDAGLSEDDDPRAASLVSAAVALDGKWSPEASREVRQLRRELSEYVQAQRPPVPVSDEGVEMPAVTSIVERLGRPRRNA